MKEKVVRREATEEIGKHDSNRISKVPVVQCLSISYCQYFAQILFLFLLSSFGLKTFFLVWQIKKHIPEINFSIFISSLLHCKY